jgi:hypothetical protein
MGDLRIMTEHPDLKRSTLQLLMAEVERVFAERGGKRIPDPNGGERDVKL